jgi:hypothetical protein
MNPFRTLYFIFFIANTYTIAKADEDDLSVALIDFADGMAVAACEANKECNAMMTAITVPIIIIYITCLCFGGIDPEPLSTKRVVRTGTGYLVGRQIF